LKGELVKKPRKGILKTPKKFQFWFSDDHKSLMYGKKQGQGKAKKAITLAGVTAKQGKDEKKLFWMTLEGGDKKKKFKRELACASKEDRDKWLAVIVGKEGNSEKKDEPKKEEPKKEEPKKEESKKKEEPKKEEPKKRRAQEKRGTKEGGTTKEGRITEKRRTKEGRTEDRPKDRQKIKF